MESEDLTLLDMAKDELDHEELRLKQLKVNLQSELNSHLSIKSQMELNLQINAQERSKDYLTKRMLEHQLDDTKVMIDKEVDCHLQN